ncbi:tetratricopeptide repeat protein [Flavobacterium sp. WC2409]|jgi:tetratricopeptide (TPR) repeat protein|uniref:Tetratricopeptide repeat protein n=3 Tax=unclassified Flavobacterium TaxID=196869 RepID=A0AB39WH82_9FLAO
MKKLTLLLLILSFYSKGLAQETKKSNTDTLLKELAENSCKCIDSINVYDKATDIVAKEISKCIDEQTGALQLGKKLMNIKDLKKNAKEKEGKKQVDISIDFNKNSEEYKKSYYELERYMMSNCSSIKDKVASTEKQSTKSVSENKKALEFYSKGQKESKNENYEKAAQYFEKAVKEDPEFAFAWDNLGISYRQLNNFDKAIESYKKSLELDPNGLMPLQNIAIVYQYKKEYSKAIEAYEKLAKVDNNNPEVFYGIGNVYTTNLKDYEKGLDNMCKAYNLYIDQKSPYRTDAEKIINIIYSEMKKQGKEEQFNTILKANHINQN